MKIKSKIGDGFFIGLVVFTILTLAMYVLWVLTNTWWPAILLTAILLIVIAPVYFFTYYELTRTELKIYSGILGKSIPYRSIISMTDADSIAPGFCLSHRRILIRYMEGDKIKATYVSPANREQFRDLVNAEINKTVALYEDAPKTKLDKDVAKARKTPVEPTNAEIRAVKVAEQEEQARNQAVVDKELRNLDKIIAQNSSPVSQQERKKAENKLLAKVRKLSRKSKKDEAESTTAHETEEQKQKRLAKEKASLINAIENAKKDQYVPPKHQSAKSTAKTEPAEVVDLTESVNNSAKKVKKVDTENHTVNLDEVKADEKATETKDPKIEKMTIVEKKKKSKAVVKKITNTSEVSA